MWIYICTTPHIFNNNIFSLFSIQNNSYFSENIELSHVQQMCTVQIKRTNNTIKINIEGPNNYLQLKVLLASKVPAEQGKF